MQTKDLSKSATRCKGVSSSQICDDGKLNNDIKELSNFLRTYYYDNNRTNLPKELPKPYLKQQLPF